MAKDNMKVISITPGQKVKTEHFKLGDTGSLEYNAQNEFDDRVECLFTPQVINKPLSTDGTVSGQPSWGLDPWTPADSLKITTAAGDIDCDKGVAYIGGRRIIRTGDGSIKTDLSNPGGAATYYVRIRYVVSTDQDSFIAEASESVDGEDNKYITLATAAWDGSANWSGETDLRSSNTSLSPPVTFSGDTDASVVAVLTITQTGTAEQSLEVYGGDSTFFTSGTPKKIIIYGNSTDAIEIHNAAVASGKLTAGTVAGTLYTDKFDIATQLDVASMTFTTTDISGALSIGDLSTITLATTGASVTLANAVDQTAAFANSGAGNLNITVDGKITASATGSSIAGSATVGGVYFNNDDVSADKITLNDLTNQIFMLAGGFYGIISVPSISTANKTYTFPDTTGTVAVSGTGAMSVDSSGQVVHSTAAGYKHVPSGGTSVMVLVGDGSGGSTWDATPSITTLTTSGAITCGTDLRVNGNDIKDSAGTTRITLGATTVINGSVQVIGNYIKDSAATTRITLGSIIIFNGDIQIGGDDIKDSDGQTKISFDASDNIDFIGPFGCDLDVHIVSKLYDMATSVLAWDECYADNWNAVSSWKAFADPVAVLKKFKPEAGDEYKIDHASVDDWMCARVKCKVKNAKGNLKWEGGYVLKSGHEKAGVREVYDEKQKKNVKVGNYADGYTDEDFEREEAYSINKAQTVLIQAVSQLKNENDALVAIIAGLESRITTLESV